MVKPPLRTAQAYARSGSPGPSAADPPARAANDAGVNSAPDDGLRIVHAAAAYVVVCKPAGMLSVPGKGPHNQDCVASRVREMFPTSEGPLIVHRLDMDTSGLLVLGLTSDAQRLLSGQFEKRQVDKAYVAVVAGRLGAERGEIDLPIRPDIERRPLQIVDHEHGRPSSTRWRLVALDAECSRVELEPVTGRTHQLRVHMAEIGHPILGDVLYGPQPQTGEASPRLLLHASYLRFREPLESGTLGDWMEFRSPPAF